MATITTQVNFTGLTLDRVRFIAAVYNNKCNALIIVNLTAILNECIARSLTFVDIKESRASEPFETRKEI